MNTELKRLGNPIGIWWYVLKCSTQQTQDSCRADAGWPQEKLSMKTVSVNQRAGPPERIAQNTIRKRPGRGWLEEGSWERSAGEGHTIMKWHLFQLLLVSLGLVLFLTDWLIPRPTACWALGAPSRLHLSSSVYLSNYTFISVPHHLYSLFILSSTHPT